MAGRVLRSLTIGRPLVPPPGPRPTIAGSRPRHDPPAAIPPSPVPPSACRRPRSLAATPPRVRPVGVPLVHDRRPLVRPPGRAAAHNLPVASHDYRQPSHPLHDPPVAVSLAVRHPPVAGRVLPLLRSAGGRPPGARPPATRTAPSADHVPRSPAAVSLATRSGRPPSPSRAPMPRPHAPASRAALAHCSARLRHGDLPTFESLWSGCG